MLIDQNIIYIIVFCLSSLVLLIVGLVFAYISAIKNYANLKNKKTESGDEEIKNIYKTMQNKLDKIVDEAKAKSEILIRSAEDFSREQSEFTKNELGKTMQSYVNLYHKSLQSLEKDVAKSVSAIPEELALSFREDIESIKVSYKENLEKSTQHLQDALQKSFMNIELEMQKYKEARIKQVDASIVEIIQQISRRVLMKEITIEEHEKIVMKALEDAIRDGIFSEEKR